jgi:hypothetical protein
MARTYYHKEKVESFKRALNFSKEYEKPEVSHNSWFAHPVQEAGILEL